MRILRIEIGRGVHCCVRCGAQVTFTDASLGLFFEFHARGLCVAVARVLPYLLTVILIAGSPPTS